MKVFSAIAFPSQASLLYIKAYLQNPCFSVLCRERHSFSPFPPASFPSTADLTLSPAPGPSQDTVSCQLPSHLSPQKAIKNRTEQNKNTLIEQKLVSPPASKAISLHLIIFCVDLDLEAWVCPQKNHVSKNKPKISLRKHTILY